MQSAESSKSWTVDVDPWLDGAGQPRESGQKRANRSRPRHRAWFEKVRYFGPSAKPRARGRLGWAGSSASGLDRAAADAGAPLLDREPWAVGCLCLFPTATPPSYPPRPGPRSGALQSPPRWVFFIFYVLHYILLKNKSLSHFFCKFFCCRLTRLNCRQMQRWYCGKKYVYMSTSN